MLQSIILSIKCQDIYVIPTFNYIFNAFYYLLVQYPGAAWNRSQTICTFEQVSPV